MKKLWLAKLALILAATAAQSHTQTFQVLYDFGVQSGSPSQPGLPGIVAQGRDGNLYSTTVYGGVFNHGAVYRITPAGELTTLYSFCSLPSCADGLWPWGGLTLGTDGNFYGITSREGGTPETVFKITPSGVLTVLHSFTRGTGGFHPNPPIQGNDGNFYGTTYVGGNSSCGNLGGCGTIYKITPSGAFTTLYTFDGTHGANPIGPLALGTDGNFYGTTTQGGIEGLRGVVFRLSPEGKLTVLHFFDVTDGAEPCGALVEGSDGNLYGTTFTGGSAGEYGTIFEITRTGTLTVLHRMNGGLEGAYVGVGLLAATDGNFYGSALEGGIGNCFDLNSGCGTLFKISPAGSYSVLYTFDPTTGFAAGSMLQDTNGVIYGDTFYGGLAGAGVFYSLDGGLAPFVRFVRNFLPVGHRIEFLGQGFTGTTAVAFNGKPALFTVVSDTYLTAIVPGGATSGFVTVTTPGGTLTSDKRFLVKPQITGFSPASGPVGSQVVITGVSLMQMWKVVFNGYVAAPFTVDSDTQVTATVPAGAASGPIGVKTTGAAVYSNASFTVTP